MTQPNPSSHFKSTPLVNSESHSFGGSSGVEREMTLASGMIKSIVAGLGADGRPMTAIPSSSSLVKNGMDNFSISGHSLKESEGSSHGKGKRPQSSHAGSLFGSSVNNNNPIVPPSLAPSPSPGFAARTKTSTIPKGMESRMQQVREMREERERERAKVRESAATAYKAAIIEAKNSLAEKERKAEAKKRIDAEKRQRELENEVKYLREKLLREESKAQIEKSKQNSELIQIESENLEKKQKVERDIQSFQSHSEMTNQGLRERETLSLSLLDKDLKRENRLKLMRFFSRWKNKVEITQKNLSIAINWCNQSTLKKFWFQFKNGNLLSSFIIEYNFLKNK